MRNVLYILAVFTLLLGGCKTSQEPPGASTAKPTALERNALELLPPGTAILRPGATEPGVKRPPAVQEVDLDGDGKRELVAGYRLANSEEEAGGGGLSSGTAGVMIAYREGNAYKKAWRQELGYRLTDIRCRDMDGDGVPEVVAGGSKGASAAKLLQVLKVYPNEKGAVDVYPLWRSGYHRVDIGDFDRDGREEMALWAKDAGNAFIVEVYSCAVPYAPVFQSVESAYQSYFPCVVAYYKDQIKTTKNTRLLWYYLADAQIKAGQTEDALSSIDRGRRSAGYPPEQSFNVLKGEALTALKRYSEALNYFAEVTKRDGTSTTGKSSGQETAKADANGTATLVRAYYSAGKAYEALERFKEAEQAYKRAKELRPDWPLPERRLQRLELYPSVKEVVRYLDAGNSGIADHGTGGLERWGSQHGLVIRAVEASPAPGANSSNSSRPLLLDIRKEQDLNASAHLIYRRDAERPEGKESFRSQIFYSADFPEHGINSGFATSDARVYVDKDGRPEMGVVYDSCAGGSGSPIPTYYLYRFKDDRWRISWRAPVIGTVWRAFHGKIEFTGQGLETLGLSGEIWTSDGKGSLFHEANAGPHRNFYDVWRRDGNGYGRVKAEILPSAYGTLIDFVWALSNGKEDEAGLLVVDKNLILKAKDAGMVQSPLGQGWLIDFGGPSQLEKGPIRIDSGSCSGTRLTFKKDGDRWLIASITKDAEN
ncbi:MAG: tetratricopeptide repeat protein [Bacillota bacterium]